ncbi:hypothetical protein BC826DRAFT_998979 [Russula brevipes]|nr:hypothetical protein BC826DRAFT_998979 [Russula brevipes]
MFDKSGAFHVEPRFLDLCQNDLRVRPADFRHNELRPVDLRHHDLRPVELRHNDLRQIELDSPGSKVSSVARIDVATGE